MFLKVRLHVANRPFSDRSHRLHVAWRARFRVWLRSRPSIRRAIPSAMTDGARAHTSSQLEYFGGGCRPRCRTKLVKPPVDLAAGWLNSSILSTRSGNESGDAFFALI